MKRFLAVLLICGMGVVTFSTSYAFPIKKESKARHDVHELAMVYINDVIVPNVLPVYGNPLRVHSENETVLGSSSEIVARSNSPPFRIRKGKTT